MPTSAPIYNDLARGPIGATGHWVETQDGVRIRIGVWNTGTKGTVLIFPGRTEYIEKYGNAAQFFEKQDYSTVSVDWRGQGLSDRLQADRSIGHVINFTDYQYDVQAMMNTADAINLPKPYYLVAHSMGGCIALRALLQNISVEAVSFSAPMWGILFHPPALRLAAWSLSTIAYPLSATNMRAPGTSADAYAATEPFESNDLTYDKKMLDMMAKQLRTMPDWALGGPSLRWLNKALREMRHLHSLPSPDYPMICHLGSEEDVVDPRRIYSRITRWPEAQLKLVPRAKHEIMMECPKVRNAFYAETCAFFDSHQPIA